MKKSILFLTVVSAVALYSCTRSIQVANTSNEIPKLPTTPFNYIEGKLPGGQTIQSFSENNFNNGGFGISFDMNGNPVNTNSLKVTNEGASLGRVLFYDKKLSLNNTISCGTCHQQDKAFTDGLALSKGFEGRITSRSTMAIMNPIAQRNLFWDSRSSNLEDLALRPVTNHIEMGMDNMDRLITKLANTSYYPDLFKKAFGTSTISAKNISSALSQFVGSITTADSKFDRVEGSQMQGPSASFSELEAIGQNLFQQNCASCHAGLNFIADDSPTGAYGGGGDFNAGTTNKKGATNIGLDFVYADNGLGNGNFKIPSLRNIAVTSPYMHDGRFKTLEEVLNHYTNGIKPHAKLDVKFKGANSSVKPIILSDVEKKAVIAFLNTLTDQTMLKDPKFSDPFQN